MIIKIKLSGCLSAKLSQLPLVRVHSDLQSSAICSRKSFKMEFFRLVILQETIAKCPGNPVEAALLRLPHSSMDIDGYTLQIFNRSNSAKYNDQE